MIASSKTTQQAEQRWNRIVERFRAACVLHRQGKAEASRRVVKEELPILVKAWIQLLPASLREDAKADLRDMFEREQTLVDRSFDMRRAFRETLVRKVIPDLEAKLSAKYRSLYIERQSRERQERESQNESSWVSPSYSRQGSGEPSASPAAKARTRVRIEDVSGMIDALQSRETGDLAASALSLDTILDTLQKSGLSRTLQD